jgi:alpha-L-fucosidase
MTTRRDFFRLATETATLALLWTSSLSAEQDIQPHATTHGKRRGMPLLDLQQRFVDLRFGMFLHFNMATFQDREWGDPTSSLELFHPTALDTDQWAAAAKLANMTWGCLTTRHHDGFCIWPTKTRGTSVRQTSHQTDVVRAYVNSFRAAGLRVGLYYSILSLRDDIRHFNITADKIQLVKDQLTELFTGYGEIDVLVTDGWNAPWSRITYEEMPFREIYDHVKSMQPNCLISDLNASQYPSGGLYYSDIKAFEQNAGQKVPQLILNAPPTREGRLAPNVVSRLAEIGRAWNHPEPSAKIDEHTVITTPNLATGKPIHASSYPEGVGPDEANDGSFQSSWYLDGGLTAGWLEVDLLKERGFNVVSLVEPVGGEDNYQQSRIRNYRFEYWNGVNWITLVEGGSPTPTTIHSIARVTARRVRLSVEGSHDMPHIADIGVYDEPS